MKTKIMAIAIQNKSEKVSTIQSILTEYNENIRTRLGLSNSLDCCKDNGLIILQLKCDEATAQKMSDKLEEINDVYVSVMDLKV